SLGTDFNYLIEVLKSRLTGVVSPVIENEWTIQDILVLTQTPKFDGERALLQQMMEISMKLQGEEELDRIQLLVDIVRQRISSAKRKNKKLPKIVVFTSFTSVAEQIWNRLEHTLGADHLAAYH